MFHQQPTAYFLTFSTYGTHLPGDLRGWVRKLQPAPGTKQALPCPNLELHITTTLVPDAFHLSTLEQQNCVLHAIQETCRYKEWRLIAAHVRTDHVHCLLQGLVTPEVMLSTLKAYATRALRQQFTSGDAKIWARHGSTLYVWDVKDLDAVTHYIVHEQGTPMAWYCFNPDPTDAPRNTHGWS